MKKLLLLFALLIPRLGTAQHQDKVDFTRAEVFVEPKPEGKSIKGLVTYEFDVLQDIDSVFLDAKNITFNKVSLNGKRIRYHNTGKITTFYKRLKKGKSYKLYLDYSAKPEQTVYFLGWDDAIEGNEQIWTQGQGKYTSHWLPSFDAMEEKVEFDLNISFDANYEVIANGKLKNAEDRDANRTWTFDMQNPMSSYLLAFAIGNYQKQELTSASGIPIQNYYYPQDSLRVEPTYRYTKEIFDFLEKEIGVPYPWQNYKQIPVRDFLYAGMENTSATIFSDGYVIDSTAFIDKNYVNVNAHELAHQWFGNLVTEKDGNHHWLHEGFATYYAYLAEKELFGEDHFYWKYYKTLQLLQGAVDREEGESLLNPGASSLTFYEKGAWALLMLRRQIGNTAFKKGVKNYLEKFRFKTVTVSDFLKEMEKSSGADLSDFRTDWLENAGLPYAEARKALVEKSESIALLFSMGEDLQRTPDGQVDYLDYWEKTNSVNFKRHILDTHLNALPEEVIMYALNSDTLSLRQSGAINIDSVPVALKKKYESLLDDESYITKESVLFKLWRSFPEDRRHYLNKTKGVLGLHNKNVRLLWLTLAILTPDYEGFNTQQYFTQLNAYTAPQYSWEIRMGAFQYLREIGFNDEGLKNLVEATGHHSWQFKKFARSLIDALLQDADYKTRIKKLSRELKKEELRYINTKLLKK